MTHNLKTYPLSRHSVAPGSPLAGLTCFLASDLENGEPVLGVSGLAETRQSPFNHLLFTHDDDNFYALTPENADVLRGLFPWLRPVPMRSIPAMADLPSFGFGDRLGLAIPGHIAALRAAALEGQIYPIFAQQSVRENARTGRTPQQVMDDATWGVFQSGWQQPWGADADHLKQVSDLLAFVEAGYTFFTVDPGEHVDPGADTAARPELMEKVAAQDWVEIGAVPLEQAEFVQRYIAFCRQAGWACVEPEVEAGTLRAIAKYGRAMLHVARMFHALQALLPVGFDFEVSVDETETPTSLLEHFYIASELKRLDVQFNSLAPRLPGRFEKGVDYIGDLHDLDDQLGHHAAIMRYFGDYRLSLHSGSDKFSVYPLLVRRVGPAFHVKTAGTSYLEALRVSAALQPELFRRIFELARERYDIDRRTYHVSAEVSRLPDPQTVPDSELPHLLDDFHARQALHVTFGSALAEYGEELKTLLKTQPDDTSQALQKHFMRHLMPLVR